MSEAKDDFDTTKFHETGILVVGLLGGFTLATLALVVSNVHAFTPLGLFWSVHLFAWPTTGSLVTPAETYLVLLIVGLGILSFWLIMTSVAMLWVTAVKDPKDLANVERWARNSVMRAVYWSCGVLFFMVFPFTNFGGLLFLIGAFFIIRTFRKAIQRDLDIVRTQRNMNNNSTTPTAKRIGDQSEEESTEA